MNIRNKIPTNSKYCLPNRSQDLLSIYPILNLNIREETLRV